MSFGLLSKTETDLPDHVQIKRSARAKRLALRLDSHNGVFNLVVPNGMSLRRAQRFAEEHESWMQERLGQLSTPIYFHNGVKVPVFGQERLIKIDYDDGLKKTDIQLNSNELLVLTNKDDPGVRIERFLKKEVRARMTDLAYNKAKKIGKTIKKIQIRDTKSRWGSCSADGSLSFSWRLILAPYESLDYLVAHEVAHLQHLNHSKAFWGLCEELSDDYKAGKSWMRKNGQELMRYRGDVTKL